MRYLIDVSLSIERLTRGFLTLHDAHHTSIIDEMMPAYRQLIELPIRFYQRRDTLSYRDNASFADLLAGRDFRGIERRDAAISRRRASPICYAIVLWLSRSFTSSRADFAHKYMFIYSFLARLCDASIRSLSFINWLFPWQPFIYLLFRLTSAW